MQSILTITITIILIILITILIFIPTIDKFDGQLCFNTQFPILNLYNNNTNNLIDYSQFSINPQKIVNPKIKKNFSPEALNFYIGLPTRN